MTSVSKTSTNDTAELERFRLFVAGVTDYAIYMLSPDGYVVTWNAGAQRFKGYLPEEIIGQHFSRFYSQADQQTGLPARALKTALEKGKFEDEGWRMRKDGTRFWASVVIDPIYEPGGALAGFAKITRDITERKKAEETLHASEERFRLLVQGVTDYAIYMLSLNGEITNWNAGAQHIKGFTHEEVVGTHFSRFYTEEDRARGMPTRALLTAATENRFEGEGWRVRKDGTRFLAHVVIDPIRNSFGELIGYAKITRDVTERRDAAAALERAKEALFQSQKLEAIGKLTGGIAHDFNNLLGVLLSGVEILAREVRSPTGIKIIDSMRRATNRGALLTQQLLSFARQQPLKQEKHNLNRVIASFEVVLRRANSDNVRFALDFDPAPPVVMIDAPQFEAALLNLVVNARDAMPDGGALSVATGKVDLAHGQVGKLPAGCYVTVTVADTGSGMSPDVLTRAIEPFFTTKDIGKGTGLGLSQVYGLMQQSGGDMKIVSETGKGTLITLYLPALDGQGVDTPDSGAGNDKALVVDDQPDVLEVAVELFRAMGYDVLSANSGADALDILRRTPDVGVLFSDIVMPGISGIELAKEARALIPDIKILLASGYAAPALNAEHGELSSFHLINKPYHMSEILKKLRMAG